MKRSAKRRCQKIVARLVDDFWAKHREELKQKDSVIDSDFIGRGLSNSTGPTCDKVGLHRQYLEKLSDFLLTSLEKDYPHLRPSTCQRQLQQALEREYGSLSRKVPGWLHASNLLQENICSNFDQGLMKDYAKTKASIANACALWEERRKVRRKKAYIGFLKWAIPITLTILGLILAIVCR